MRILASDGDHFTFQLSQREKGLFIDLLRLYPLIPSSHHRVSRTEGSPVSQTCQKLLDEALAEHREENRRQVLAMIEEEGRFVAGPEGFRCSLSWAQVEWLLQVLNDLRVGSWLILGEPDEKNGQKTELTAENAHFLWVMEVSGFFQTFLLAGLGGSASTS